MARLLIKEDWSYFVIDVDKNTGALFKVWPLDLDESGFEYDSIVSFGRVETRCFFLTASEKGICGYCLDVTVGVSAPLQIQVVDVPANSIGKGMAWFQSNNNLQVTCLLGVLLQHINK